MSKHHGLHCKTCDSEFSMRSRNGLHAMTWLRDHAAVASEALLVFADAPHQIEWSVRIWNEGAIDFVWLGIHQKHELVVTDEYGNEYP